MHGLIRDDVLYARAEVTSVPLRGTVPALF